MKRACLFVALAAAPLAHGRPDQVSLITRHEGSHVDGTNTNEFPSATHPTILQALRAYGFGTVFANIRLGWMRTSAFARSDNEWTRSVSESEAAFEEVATFGGDCRPELNNTFGTLRIRRPTLVLTAGTGPAQFMGGLAPMALTEVRVTVDGQTAYYENIEQFWGQPPSTFATEVSDVSIIFGVPCTITLTTKVRATALSFGFPERYAFGSALVTWEGIEGAFDGNGVAVPCRSDCAVLCANIAPPPSCPGDANGDSKTDGRDLSILLGQYGQVVPPFTGANYNGDAAVNGADLQVLLGDFGCDGDH